MPKIFRRKGSAASLGGDGADPGASNPGADDMTVGSGWSRGASVSGRIMDRMKLNLSLTRDGGGLGASFRSLNDNDGGGGGGLGDSSRALNDSSANSVGSRKSAGSAGRGTRRPRIGMPRRAASSRAAGSSSYSLPPGGRPSRGKSSRTYGSGAALSMGVEAMEEMDSTEALALRGQTFGRRRRSGPHRRGHARPGGSAAANGPVAAPAEHSLAELRSMAEAELREAMAKAGVSEGDVAKALEEAGADGAAGWAAEEKRKTALVAHFVNSGRVKLVAKASAERRSSQVSAASKAGNAEGTLDAVGAGADAVGAVGDVRPPPAVTFGDTCSVKSSLTKKELRKTKLEKIAELKTDNSKVKRENKSLKKTVKKLLGQLTEANKEKEELRKSLNEEKERRSREEAGGDAPAPLLPPIDEDDSAAGGVGTGRTGGPPLLDIVARTDNDDDGKGLMLTPDDGSMRQASLASERSARKKTDIYRRKYEKEKEARLNEEFRLKAEADILNKEVEGLQRELASSLKALDDAKRSAKESRASASGLRHALRGKSARVEELTAEAAARDQLIATFTQVLLQRVGLEGGEGESKGVSGSFGEEEKLSDALAGCRPEDFAGAHEKPPEDIAGTISDGSLHEGPPVDV